MNFGIITYGSRGDVQPFIALSLRLMKHGHNVTLLAPENFKEFIEGYGVTCYPLYGNSEEIINSQEGLRLLKTGNMLTFLRYIHKNGRKLQPLINQDILSGCVNTDVLITSVLCVIWVWTIAEKLNKNWGIVHLNPPSTPTKSFPFAGLAFFNLPRYNLFTYWLIGALYWQFNIKDLNDFRLSLGLSSFKRPMMNKRFGENILELYAFSPQLIARPADWPDVVQITGFLTLPSKSRETNKMDHNPRSLVNWLEAGDKPVYIGFGSIPIPDAKLLSNILNEIISKTQLRIILCKGWSVIANLPDHANLFVVKYTNHEWLFPQCKAAIIHGGAGTVAAVLKAEIPMIVVSIFGDQPWWGKIIQDKNLGVHLAYKDLTAGKLLHAIEKTQTLELIHKAIETGEKINNEDGLESTVSFLEKHFA